MMIKDLIKKPLNRDIDPELQVLTPGFIRFFEIFIVPSWWVVFILLICYMAYEVSLQKINEDYSKLYQQYQELHIEKQKALLIQEDYLLQVNSQSDQDWVELTLMKGLDLVPEDQIKVFFSEQEESKK